MPPDEDALGIELAKRVRGYMREAMAPLIERIAGLERQFADRPIAEAVASYLAANPPAAGEPGAAGKDADAAEVAAALEPIVAEQLANLEIDPVRLEAMIAEAVAKIPAPTDGKDGDPGPPGEKGEPGADGIGLAGALIDREGGLVITLTDGTTKALGVVVGKNGEDGEPGADGKDGFGLSDFDTELKDGGRTLVLKFGSGDLAEVHELALPVPLYRGVFKDGQSYDQGDLVTWAGSMWHCDEPTTAKPGEGASGWTLAVKRGRDGQDRKS